MVEFALSLAFFVPLLVGVISVGNIVHERSVAANAVRMGGRIAAQVTAVGVEQHSYEDWVFGLTRGAIREVLLANNLEPSAYTLRLQASELDYDTCSSGEEPNPYCPMLRILLEVKLCSNQSIMFFGGANCVNTRFIVEESAEPFAFDIIGYVDGSGESNGGGSS